LCNLECKYYIVTNFPYELRIWWKNIFTYIFFPTYFNLFQRPMIMFQSYGTRLISINFSLLSRGIFIIYNILQQMFSNNHHTLY